jgi:hypothetical protein
MGERKQVIAHIDHDPPVGCARRTGNLQRFGGKSARKDDQVIGIGMIALVVQIDIETVVTQRLHRVEHAEPVAGAFKAAVMRMKRHAVMQREHVNLSNQYQLNIEFT